MAEPDRPFQLERRGVALKPDQASPYERGGVLNPAAVQKGGVTYLFYRAVATTPPNYSRIMIATCKVAEGYPIVAEKLNRIALEPEPEYELWHDGRGGGVEDPRITPLEGAYYMAYTAYGTVDGAIAPRIALAHSRDLFAWERMGLVRFSPLELNHGGRRKIVDLNAVPNKDAMLFPQKIGGRYCMLHRPMFGPETGEPHSIWLSWSDDLLNWDGHRLVAEPKPGWEGLKVGAGTPPVLTPLGWLTFYHGVEGKSEDDPARRYHAGALLLDPDDPARVVYRSPRPVLSPESPDEKTGVVANVVFPTGLVEQQGGRFHVYYGMADQAIGLASATMPAAGELRAEAE